ncbi:MAG: hypothetical protein LBE06_05975, partial [Azoarcus sp.]|nr:hypothetical protein [Azoarcus sp.]
TVGKNDRKHGKACDSGERIMMAAHTANVTARRAGFGASVKVSARRRAGSKQRRFRAGWNELDCHGAARLAMTVHRLRERVAEGRDRASFQTARKRRCFLRSGE